jgi:hypothetical protein
MEVSLLKNIIKKTPKCGACQYMKELCMKHLLLSKITMGNMEDVKEFIVGLKLIYVSYDVKNRLGIHCIFFISIWFLILLIVLLY